MHPSYFFYRANLTRLQQTYFEEILSMSLLWRSLQRGMTFASFFYPETSTSFFFLRHLYSSTCLHGLSHDSFTVPRYEPLDPRFFIFFACVFAFWETKPRFFYNHANSSTCLDKVTVILCCLETSKNLQNQPFIDQPSYGLEIHWFIDQPHAG